MHNVHPLYEAGYAQALEDVNELLTEANKQDAANYLVHWYSRMATAVRNYEHKKWLILDA